MELYLYPMKTNNLKSYDVEHGKKLKSVDMWAVYLQCTVSHFLRIRKLMNDIIPIDSNDPWLWAVSSTNNTENYLNKIFTNKYYKKVSQQGFYKQVKKKKIFLRNDAQYIPSFYFACEQKLKRQLL